MEHIIRILTFALIPIIVNGVFVFLRQPKTAEKGKVHLPKFFAILGAISSALFLVPAIITAFSDEAIWVPIGFLVFSLLGATLIVAFVNCRISYDEDGFVAKTFFGIKRKVSYDQVTAIKENMHETYIYIGKRRVMVDEFSIGGKEFINLVKKKYRTLHNGQSLPKITKTKNDIFNGNVKDVTGFYVAYGLVSVLLVGFIVFSVCDICIPKNVNNTVEQTVTFKAYDVKEDEVILTSTDDNIYKISYTAEKININGIKSICNGKSKVTTYSKEVTPDDEDDFYSIKAIKYNDRYLLSFEEESQLYRQESWPIVALFLFVLLIWVAFIVASIVVGRNPQKFSRKVVKMFFKDGYINY